MEIKTHRNVREIEIEEFYSKENGIVYWNYRFNGGKWHKEQSPYKEIPWIEFQPPNKLK